MPSPQMSEAELNQLAKITEEQARLEEDALGDGAATYPLPLFFLDLVMTSNLILFFLGQNSSRATLLRPRAVLLAQALQALRLQWAWWSVPPQDLTLSSWKLRICE